MSTPAQRFTFGYHLNTWDLAGLPLEDGLAAVRRNGFPYVEALSRDDVSRDYSRRYMGTGHKPFPPGTTDVAYLSRISALSRAAAQGLKVSSLYCNREFVNPVSWDVELSTLEGVLRVLAGFGAPGLVLGGGPPAPPGADHDPAVYRALAASLNQVADAAAGLGMWVAYHPHIDTAVQDRAQVDRLMDAVGDGGAGLCIDTAHLAMVGSDPVSAVADYASVLRYVHFKDVADQTGISGPARFTSFRPLGQGVVDIPGVTAQLLADGYDGIVVVELDSSDQPPEEALQDSVRYLDGLGLRLDPAAVTP